MICGGILLLIYIALGLYALISILGSNATTLAKVVWLLIVYFIPILGWLLWLFIGPKSAR